MEINEKIFINLLKTNLSLDHYYLLNSIKQRMPLVTHKKVEGYVGFLEKKGWVEINKGITPDGIKILAQIEENEVILEVIANREQSFTGFCRQLFENIETKIVELTGKKQWKNPSGKSLKPSNANELQQRLDKFIKQYHYKDLNRISDEILKHVEYSVSINKLNIKDKYVRTVYYFIMRDGFPSDLLEKCNGEIEENKINDSSNETAIGGVYIA